MSPGLQKTIFAEDVGLNYHGSKYLEDFFLNPDYASEYHCDVMNRKYYRKNPNEIVLDLMGIKV